MLHDWTITIAENKRAGCHTTKLYKHNFKKHQKYKQTIVTN